MLTVTSLWAQLVIGDRTNQFTGTPAIGTNPPTYGDYPWRIYNESLVERYTVLNALQVTINDNCAVTNVQHREGTGNSYDEEVTSWNSSTWADGYGAFGRNPNGACIWQDTITPPERGTSKQRCQYVISVVATNVGLSCVELWGVCTKNFGGGAFFMSFESEPENENYLYDTLTGPFSPTYFPHIHDTQFENSGVVTPDFCGSTNNIAFGWLLLMKTLVLGFSILHR